MFDCNSYALYNKYVNARKISIKAFAAVFKAAGPFNTCLFAPHCLQTQPGVPSMVYIYIQYSQRNIIKYNSHCLCSRQKLYYAFIQAVLDVLPN